MKIIALALRRSGSTAFWEVFRSNPDYLALDEPCNPKLKELPKPHHKGTWGPFIDIYQSGPAEFRRRFAPVLPDQELAEELPARTADYLKFLVGDQPNWFMDLTRCHFKVARLAEEFPDATLIHLYRDPRGFVSSHMLPSYGGLRARCARFVNRRIFWASRGGYDMWNVQSICERGFRSVAPRLREHGIPDQALAHRTAHERLLLYWLLHYRYLEQKGRRAFGARFHSICFDAFCADPRSHLAALFRDDPAQLAALDVTHLHAASLGQSPADPRWAAAMQRVGFLEQEIGRWTAGGAGDRGMSGVSG